MWPYCKYPQAIRFLESEIWLFILFRAISSYFPWSAVDISLKVLDLFHFQLS
jgi:hypothetical protein